MLTPEKLTEMLRLMRRIRHFEERLTGMYDYTSYLKKGDTAGDMYDFASKGIIPGAVHLSIGQEGAQVGMCAALDRDDYVTSTLRGHGHCIAKGAELKPMMAELMGRRDGYSRGCGGSMHIFAPELGLLGGNGIICAQLPLATGAAFSAKYRGTPQVAVAFFSEGASNEGTFHEALNLAALWKLPVIFLCENNLYAATTPAEIALASPDVAGHAAGYGIPGEIVDGQDVLAVYAVAEKAVARARAGAGPTLIECKTYRYFGHCGIWGDPRDPAEVAAWKARDPIALFAARLRSEGMASEAELESMAEELRRELDAAVAFAMASPAPRPEEVTSDVYSE